MMPASAKASASDAASAASGPAHINHLLIYNTVVFGDIFGGITETSPNLPKIL